MRPVRRLHLLNCTSSSWALSSHEVSSCDLQLFANYFCIFLFESFAISDVVLPVPGAGYSGTLSVLPHSHMCPLCASSMSSTVLCTSPALFLWYLEMDFYDVYCIYLEVSQGQSSISNMILFFFSRKFFYPSNLCLLYYVFNSFFFFIPSIVSPRRNPWFSHHFDLLAACLLVESSQTLAELWIVPAARLGLVVSNQY